MDGGQRETGSSRLPLVCRKAAIPVLRHGGRKEPAAALIVFFVESRQITSDKCGIQLDECCTLVGSKVSSDCQTMSLATLVSPDGSQPRGYTLPNGATCYADRSDARILFRAGG